MTMIEICQELESRSRQLIGENGLKAGQSVGLIISYQLFYLKEIVTFK